MNNHARPLLAFLILSGALFACVLPAIPGLPPAGAPPPSNATATPPFSSDQVGTAVAMTLTGAAPMPATPGTGSTQVPGGPGAALPHSLYSLGTDSAGLNQVFRLETDGTTQHQVTSEPVSVNDYDVSPLDGSVAFIANNQLLWINADGSNRRVVVDAGPMDPNNPFLTSMSSPVFSPDGQTLAYGYKGLQLYSLATGQSNLVIENQINDVGGGLFTPQELYSPQRFSPDGTKLLITLSYQEGGSSAIFDPSTGALTRLDGGEGALICCDSTQWSADSASVYAASPTSGMFSSGLWKVDASTGEVTTLIPGDAGGGNYNAAAAAYLAPDGQLYFFFDTLASPDNVIIRSPLQMVRSAPDGASGRTVLRPETFDLLNEALWAPDASFAVVVIAPARETYQGGQAEVVYADGRPIVPLVASSQKLKWGP